MASVSQATEHRPDEEKPPRRSRRRKTSHLKEVPQDRAHRDALRTQCAEVAARLGKSNALSKDAMEQVARGILEAAGEPESYLGWIMVVLAGEFWRSQVAAVPYERRLLLLPHCLKHAEGCPADYDEFGLDCRQCGACSIADFRTEAEDLGYKVLVAEGSPIVLKIIIGGYVDAIVGVACLNVLEKAIDKILLAGIPCMAIPLLSSDCRNTSVDEDLVAEMIRLTPQQPVEQTRTYMHLMRAAAKIFEPEDMDRLVPRLRGGPRLAELNGDASARLDPVASTETIAYDFLSKGGKHSRPFITLAVYDALTDGSGTLPNQAADDHHFSDPILRAAMSIETFHKASLVHDDIEDDDAFRYGEETMHRRFGTPTAINVGDYLIGLGYRLVSRESETLGGDTVAGILDTLADAHMRLSEGQGAELMWRDSLDKRLSPLDALKIYALKTAPAFEAAVMAGARLAGKTEAIAEPVSKFARHLGVAFQILNDLKDFSGDSENKKVQATDVLGGRPTILWALALEGLDETERGELEQLMASSAADSTNLPRIRRLYQSASVFDKAERLVEKYRERAEQVADEIEPESLRRLFYYLIDTVLDELAAKPEPNVIDVGSLTLMQETS